MNEYEIMVQMLPTDDCDCGEDQFFTMQMSSNMDYELFMATLEKKMSLYYHQATVIE